MSLQILIDADGCPVVDETLATAKKFNVPCLILCDTAHDIQREGARTVVVTKGADSVDFILLRMVNPGDIVVTQDYGLAAMCLARGATPLHQDGLAYTDKNIDSMLLARHTSHKLRGGKHKQLKGPKKRTAKQNTDFIASLTTLLQKATAQSELPDAPLPDAFI